MSKRFDVVRGAEPLVTAAVDYLAASRHMPNGQAVAMVERNLAALIHAAREFMDSVDSLEAGEMPRSWRRPEQEARSA